MRVQWKKEGGFAYLPGLNKPREIDADSLPEPKKEELERRIQSANFFQKPEEVEQRARGAADYQQYQITVEEGGRTHTVNFSDVAPDSDLLELFDYLDELE